MKTKSVSAICIAFLLASCQPPVTFTEPLPPDGENESAFPQSITGIYKRNTGDDYLKITSNTIFNTGSYQPTISKHEAESSDEYHLNGNTLTDIKNDITIKVTLKNDTLYGNWNFTDTIFILNEFNPARKFKGHYFLNKKTDEGYEVLMLTPEKNQISIQNISDHAMLDELQQATDVKIITDTSNEVTAYKASPTKKELKKFIRNYTTAGELFTKVSE